MKLKALFENNGSITTKYRRLEQEFEDLMNELYYRRIKVEFEPKRSGNIWENCELLERNIAKAKEALKN